MPMAATPTLPVPYSPRPSSGWQTVADLVDSFGGIPTKRIRMDPVPGTATEEDCLRTTDTDRPCELIDRTLVEKAVGTPEGFLGHTIALLLSTFVRPKRLGMVMGEGGFFRMDHGNIRLPDASFTKRERLPNPLPQVGGWCPDLCVEVQSPDNTHAEMERKRKEYFSSGCRLLWILDKKTRTCEVYANEFECVEIDANGTLDGGNVLPGLAIAMKEIFAEYDDYFPSRES